MPNHSTRSRYPFTQKDVDALSKEYIDKHGFEPTQVHVVATYPPKRIEIKGIIKHVLYKSRKSFEGTAEYMFDHEFEGPLRPYYGVCQSGRHFILGGGFTVTPHGIEDEESNTYDIPQGESYQNCAFPSKIAGMGDMYSLILLDGKEVKIPNHVLGYAKIDNGKRYGLYITPNSLVSGFDVKSGSKSNPRKRK